MAQSRASEELAADASLTAAVGTLLTDGLGERMSDSGHGREGRAAEKAARATKDAADAAATAARQNRHLEEGRPVPIEGP